MKITGILRFWCRLNGHAGQCRWRLIKREAGEDTFQRWCERCACFRDIKMYRETPGEPRTLKIDLTDN